jgi:hypothetical protein
MFMVHLRTMQPYVDVDCFCCSAAPVSLIMQVPTWGAVLKVSDQGKLLQVRADQGVVV